MDSLISWNMNCILALRIQNRHQNDMTSNLDHPQHIPLPLWFVVPIHHLFALIPKSSKPGASISPAPWQEYTRQFSVAPENGNSILSMTFHSWWILILPLRNRTCQPLIFRVFLQLTDAQQGEDQWKERKILHGEGGALEDNLPYLQWDKNRK